MSARIFSRSALVALLVSLGSSCEEPVRPRRPDVVLIVIDTLRADRLSTYGYGRPTSPFMDELASQGTLFEDVTCQFSWTRPSMVSLFHGQYLTAYRDAMQPDVPALAEVFRDAGYRTVGVVANQILTREGGFDRGFDHYDVGPSRRKPEDAPDPARDLAELSEELWRPLQRALRPEPLAGRATPQDPNQPPPERPPVLVYLHALDPHAPYEPRPEMAAALRGTEAEPVLPEGWQAEAIAELGPPPPETGGAGAPWQAELDYLQLHRDQYDQEVRHTDRQLRELFAGLRELGVLDNAIVAIVSDHGESLWEHVTPMPEEDLRELVPWHFFYQSHGASQFQEVLATPMILWGVGVPKGRRVEHAVENVDLLPTLLELADLPTPGKLHGRSLVPAMNLREGTPREYVFSYGVHGNSVRETASGFKLIVPRGNSLRAGHEPQLFDLRADPHEREDLAEGRPEVVRRLVKQWREWRARYPTEDNLSSAMGRRADREQRRLLESLGYTEFDIGGGEGDEEQE